MSPGFTWYSENFEVLFSNSIVYQPKLSICCLLAEVFFFLSPQVMAVKKNIEDVQGKDNYPCGQQLLIHNGKVLKDETTLVENKVSEDGFLVVMLSKVYFFLQEYLAKQLLRQVTSIQM